MSNVPNFDAMDKDELMEFWKNNHCAGRNQAATLFPDRPKHYVKTVWALAAYAANKAAAVSCRLNGKINEALVYEGICDRIYNDLPQYAKW